MQFWADLSQLNVTNVTLNFTETCPGEAGVAGIPTYSNAKAVGDNTTNGKTITLECATNYSTADNVVCTCDTTGNDSLFSCNPSYSPTCLPCKNTVIVLTA